MSHFKLVVICSDSTVANRAKKEIWRKKLLQLKHCEIKEINKNDGIIPSCNQNHPKDVQVLLITGEHGSVDLLEFNEISLVKWQDWVDRHKNQPPQFDIIIMDLCDSTALLSIGIASLLKPSGLFISSIATCHGMRDVIVNAAPTSLYDIQKALITYIQNSNILGGCNISFAKKRANPFPRSLFFSGKITEIHDKKVPMTLAVDELLQRQKVIRVIKSKGVISKEKESLIEFITSEKALSELYSNQLSWMKIGLWFTSFLVFLGLVKLYSMMNANIEDFDICDIKPYCF
ncbi:Uncharacterised protein [Legionella busanensis]|uniref:Uncharacterized protein n=1 Tax=Legionella busanensis TaxID=190655 RepID=A0A378JPS0_9GAMM|nr:hypothetical protein [Legionella busanensis]STX51950.1 Uncharacterised protein [Legionella busanensis]